MPTIPCPRTRAPPAKPGPCGRARPRRSRSEAQVTKMIAESVAPLQFEVSALKEKLARKDANPSRFEVSLSSIPPELEQQLELALRNDFGPKVSRRPVTSPRICWHQPNQPLTEDHRRLPSSPAASPRISRSLKNEPRTFPRMFSTMPANTCVAAWRTFTSNCSRAATPSSASANSFWSFSSIV